MSWLLSWKGQAMSRKALIIGCGYTGRRTARLLLARGWEVTATARDRGALADLAFQGATVLRFDASSDSGVGVSSTGTSVLLSVPTLRSEGSLDDPTARIIAALDGKPKHLTYLSTTGVYGATRDVDESTPPAPRSERQLLRAIAEEAVRTQSFPSLVLRPAAIYGPGRGVHSAMRKGQFRLSRGRPRYVSRIHVDDLAEVVAGAMARGTEGAYPVADELPASSREVATFCAQLLGLEMPPSVPDDDLSETRRSDRRVSGRAILDLVGHSLLYPTFREGIAASVAIERASLRKDGPRLDSG